MYFSKVKLRLSNLSPQMLDKHDLSGYYASHQWLWQLFPEQSKRHFLFREELEQQSKTFYLLSDSPPNQTHNLFDVQTKPFAPMLEQGILLAYSLRANPVICRQGKRFDVLMNAKYLAKKNHVEPDLIWHHQQQAAKAWLLQQGEKHGFSVAEEQGGSCLVTSYQQHNLQKKVGDKPIQFSSVDYQGILQVTQPEIFINMLKSGIGKSKSLGCGLFLLKKV